MPKSLTSQQLADYERDGVVFPLPVLSHDETRRFRTGYEELLAAFHHKPKSTELAVTHLHFRWAWDLVTHPKVLDAVEDVLGRICSCGRRRFSPNRHATPATLAFTKTARIGGLDSTLVTTAWIALSPSTVESGCMRVAPGTQKDPIHPHKETWAEDNLLSRGQEVQVDVAGRGCGGRSFEFRGNVVAPRQHHSRVGLQRLR